MNMHGWAGRTGIVIMMLCALSEAAHCGDRVMRIGPVALGATSSTVKRMLGPPRSVTHTEGFIKSTFVYEGMIVRLDEDGKVAGMRSTDAKYCLDGWLCPGVKYSKAAALAGRDAEISPASIVIYGDGCWAVAQKKGERVESVEIRCDP